MTTFFANVQSQMCVANSQISVWRTEWKQYHLCCFTKSASTMIVERKKLKYSLFFIIFYYLIISTFLLCWMMEMTEIKHQFLLEITNKNNIFINRMTFIIIEIKIIMIKIIKKQTFLSFVNRNNDTLDNASHITSSLLSRKMLGPFLVALNNPCCNNRNIIVIFFVKVF